MPRALAIIAWTDGTNILRNTFGEFYAIAKPTGLNSAWTKMIHVVPLSKLVILLARMDSLLTRAPLYKETEHKLCWLDQKSCSKLLPQFIMMQPNCSKK